MALVIRRRGGSRCRVVGAYESAYLHDLQGNLLVYEDPGNYLTWQ